MRKQRVQIRRGFAFELDAVGLKTKRDRRIEAIGKRKRSAQEIAITLMTPPRLVPDGLDALART